MPIFLSYTRWNELHQINLTPSKKQKEKESQIKKLTRSKNITSAIFTEKPQVEQHQIWTHSIVYAAQTLCSSARWALHFLICRIFDRPITINGHIVAISPSTTMILRCSSCSSAILRSRWMPVTVCHAATVMGVHRLHAILRPDC